jgi:hypothetical protein
MTVGNQGRALEDEPPNNGDYVGPIAHNAAIWAQSNRLFESKGSDVVQALSCFLLIILESLGLHLDAADDESAREMVETRANKAVTSTWVWRCRRVTMMTDV